jgi:hypothetical protein
MDQPLDRYLTLQFYETILLLHQGEQMLLLVLVVKSSAGT